MANILVIAEMLDGKVRKSTHSAITFARNAGGTFSILVLGQGAQAAAAEVTGFGAQKVLVCDDAYLAQPIGERFAPTVAAVKQKRAAETAKTDTPVGCFKKSLPPVRLVISHRPKSACSVEPVAIATMTAAETNGESARSRLSAIQTFARIEPIQTPGQTCLPHNRSAARAMPDGGQTAVTFPGGIARSCPSVPAIA